MSMRARMLIQWGVFFVVISLSCQAVAQSSVALATRKAELQTLSQELRARDARNRVDARAFSQALGIPMRRELPNGGVLELQRIAPGIGPVFYITNNVDAADTVSTDEVYPGGSAGLALDGTGMTIGEWDGGAVYADHPDFLGRLTQADGATVVSNHSTHVAGTLVGSGEGLYTESRGMAYAAYLDAYDWTSDTAEMAAAAADGLLVSNHSYGIAAGWLYLGGSPPDTWWWIGGADPSDVEDPNFGYYDSETALWDQIAWDAPYYLIVKASGNDRTDIGPAPGEEYTVVDPDGNFLFTSTLPREPDCAPAGYDCMPTNSGAKNVLTVGAVDDVIGGYSSLAGPTQVQMADFSGWGPTDDGRIKPDLVGNGILLFSAWGEYPWYASAIGTSMATPNIAGSLILLQEHYEDLHGPGNYMRAATLKALAIHTADETGDAPGPDYEYGWGLLNTKTAAQLITDDGLGDQQIIEDSLPDGGTDTFNVNVSDPDSIITATLVWTDPPGTPVAPTLDPPDRMLVNDLDLRIKRGGTTFMPWVLDPANPSAPATTGDNDRDNVEQVVASATSTGSYTIEVSHKGALLDGASQDYSLIISVKPSPPTGSTLVIDEDFTGGLPAGWSVQTESGVPWTIRTPVAGDSRYDNLTGGTGEFAMVDNNYSHISRTSLVAPVLDLSAAQSVILRFRSFFLFDLLESINVDLSTDGGLNWSNVWTYYGFNPYGTHYVFDLSSEAAGQANFALRFRFDSNGDIQGNLWQVDDVELEAFGGGMTPTDPPAAASSAVPADGAGGVAVNATLDWSAGSGVDTHDVYFGTSVSPPWQTSQSVTGFDPGPLDFATTYYWRVDEVNAAGTTAGTLWSFTTEAGAQNTPVHVAGAEPSAIPGTHGRWSASLLATVVDENGAAAPNVVLDGTWSGGTNGAGSCTTGTNGQCSVQKSNLKNSVTSVVFTIDNLSGAGMVYDSGADEVDTQQTIYKDGGGGNLLPVAVNDSYATPVDTALTDNVMANDDPGDAPATVTAFDATSGQGGTVSMAGDGGFTYTPPAGFEGSDSFGYTITDANGDSDSATVTILVEPSGSGGGDLTLTVGTSRNKGDWYADLIWSGGSGSATVTITRDGAEIAGSPTANDGQYSDLLGKKVSGSFTYEVCDSGGCASDTVQL